MPRKLLISRLGAGSITIALCAALPGCNLATVPTLECIGHPSSRGMSSVECPVDARPDTPGDATSSDAPRDTADAPVGDLAGDRP